MEPILNYRRLDSEAPDWRKLTLGYRGKEITAPKAQNSVFSYLIVGTLFGLLAAAIGVMTTANFGTKIAIGWIGYAIPLVALSAAVWAFVTTGGKWQVSLLILSVGTASPFLFDVVGFVLVATPAHMAVSLVVIYGVMAFTDLLVRHNYEYVIGNPRLPVELRDRRLTWFKNRFKPPELARNLRELEAERAGTTDQPKAQILDSQIQEVKLLQKYRIGLFTMFFAYAVASSLPTRLFCATLTFFVPCLIAWNALLKRYPNPKTALFESFGTFRRTLVSWFFYGHSNADAPGMLRTPGGPMWIRKAAPAVLMGALCISTLPTVRYFPIAYDFTSWANSWTEDSEKVMIGAHPNDATLFFGDGTVERTPAFSGAVRGYSIISRISYGWMLVAGQGLSNDNPLYLLAFLIAAAACVTFPPLMLFNFFAVSGAPLLAHVRRAIDSPGVELRKDATDWSCYVERLQNSQIPLEKEHLWLGVHAEDDYPILLHRKILTEHAYIVGDSGSGKTALGIAPMVTQLLKMNHAAIVIIDLKGDNTLFQSVMAEASNAGRRFKYFTNEIGKSTHIFNPFQQTKTSDISLNQVCETMLEALNLSHGEGYGRSYFSRVARRWLSATLKKRPNLQSFEELYQISKNKEDFATDQERQDAFELVAVIESLASFDQLNLTETSTEKQAVKNAIHMPDVIANREVVYFWLPAAIETATVREIAKLALYSLLTSAYLRQRNAPAGTEPEQTFLVIDEFQRLASENFKIILEQARAFGIGAILANQSLADLKLHDADLRPTVLTNTRLKLCFSASDIDQQNTLIWASGTKISWSLSFNNESSRVGFSEQQRPRLGRNEIIQISDDPHLAVCQISRGSGYSQYSGFSVPLQTGFSIIKKVYDERRCAAWPPKTEDTIIPRHPIPENAYPTPEARLQATPPGEVTPPTDREPSPAIAEYKRRLVNIKKQWQDERARIT